MDAGVGISVRLRVENTLFKTVVRSGTPIRLRFSRSSELMCSNTLAAKLLVIASLRCSSQTNMSGIVFSTRNRTEIPIPASICCSDAPISRYSRNQSLFPPYLLQFRPNGQKTDMLRSLEQKIDGKLGIFGRFPVQNTMPDMFDWLEHRSDSIASNFAVREYLNT